MRIALGLVAFSLAALLAAQWIAWKPLVAAVAGAGTNDTPAGDSVAAAPAQPDAAALLTPPPPLEEYASVTERPLFLPDRRPPPAADANAQTEAPPVEASVLDGVDVSGVLISPLGVSAWVRKPNEPGLTRVRAGDDLLGWKIEDIQKDRLVLKFQDSTRQLPLRDYANAPPPIAPTRLPQRRPPAGATPSAPPVAVPLAVPKEPAAGAPPPVAVAPPRLPTGTSAFAPGGQ